MIKPKCELDCEMEDLDEKSICCYWCDLKSQCANPCSNIDCKSEKERQMDENN